MGWGGARSTLPNFPPTFPQNHFLSSFFFPRELFEFLLHGFCVNERGCKEREKKKKVEEKQENRKNTKKKFIPSSILIADTYI